MMEDDHYVVKGRFQTKVNTFRWSSLVLWWNSLDPPQDKTIGGRPLSFLLFLSHFRGNGNYWVLVGNFTVAWTKRKQKRRNRRGE